MTFNVHPKFLSTVLPILAMVIALFSIAADTAIQAQNAAAPVRQVRVVENDEAGVANPAGLAFSPNSNTFYVLEVGEAERLPLTDPEFIKLTPFGERRRFRADRGHNRGPHQHSL